MQQEEQKANPAVFCDELIEKVYWGEPKSYSGSDCFLDCYYDMAFHVCGRYRLIFETARHYISLGADGVVKLEKKGPVDSIRKEGELIEPTVHVDDEDDVPWVDSESTLFVGERLMSVAETPQGFHLGFDPISKEMVLYKRYARLIFYQVRTACAVS